MKNKGYARSPWAPGYEKFWRANKVHYGRCTSGVWHRETTWKLGRVNFGKDFWVCYWGRDHKNWPIADRRIPRNHPRNKCGMHFSSSSLHLWRMVMYGVTWLSPIHRWSRSVLRHFPEVRIVFAFALQIYKFFSHSQL